MLPVIEAFMAAHQLPDVTVVADAGMVSEANQKAIEAAGLSFILGAKIPSEPYVVTQWRREHPGQDIPDGEIFTQPWPAGPSGGRRDQVICYQYKADRARRGFVNPGWPHCSPLTRPRLLRVRAACSPLIWPPIDQDGSWRRASRVAEVSMVMTSSSALMRASGV
jgi:hypothetical protein